MRVPRLTWPAITRRRVWLAVAALAVVVRLYVMVRTTGTNDVPTWKIFGVSIAWVGLFDTYRTVPLFDHPPLMSLWILFARTLGGADGRWFPCVFKLLPLAGDVLAAWLLFRHAKARPGAKPEAGLELACLFLWNPVTLLVTAYHGNTDPLLASLCLWAALCAQAGNPIGAGLALGAAFNVKILALILLVPLALSARSIRDALRFGAAFAVTCIPFLPPLLVVGSPFIEHVFSYNSVLRPWGLGLFFEDIQAINYVGPHFARASQAFVPMARFVIVGGAALTALVMRLRGGSRWLEVAAFGLSTALVLAPGFGYQYLAWPVPLLFAIDRRRAMTNAVLGGFFIGILYLHFWDGQVPAYSVMRPPWPRFGVVLGAITWANLVGWSWWLGKSILSSRRDPSPAADEAWSASVGQGQPGHEVG